jgi:hypothetical protein
MKTIYFLLLLLFVPICLPGQTPQKIQLDNNKTSSESIKPELQQIFPDFRNGQIYYKNKNPIKCMLNYNFLLDEVLFINEKGETMALANPEDLKYVLITDRMFIPSPQGYFEVVERGKISLLYKWHCRITETRKEGALGLPTDAPSVYQMNRISFDNKEWKMDVDKEAVASVEVIPYLNKESKFVLIQGAKSYLKVFKSEKSEIKRYLDQNPVDFRKESDLRRMTIYCNSLIE